MSESGTGRLVQVVKTDLCASGADVQLFKILTSVTVEQTLNYLQDATTESNSFATVNRLKKLTKF